MPFWPATGGASGGQAGDELGVQERDAAAPAEGVLGLAHADGGLHGELAQEAQHVVAVAAADDEPGRVGDQAGRHAGHQGEREVDLLIGRERPGRQQHRRGRQRDAELLHQDPGE